MLGIIVGILIACFSFLVDSTKLQTINGEFDGQVARSTVRRDYIQTQFLNKIGEQIHVLKLQNLLFFGTIISIEEKIDKLLELSDKDASKKRIKYLILDFKISMPITLIIQPQRVSTGSRGLPFQRGYI